MYAELRQLRTVLRQTDRHNTDRADPRVELGEVVHCSVEVFAVVLPRHEHDLRVLNDLAVGKIPHDRENVRCFGIAEELAAQLRIGSVHGDVDRREALLDDTVEVFPRRIRKGDVVAVEKRQAEVLILEPERTSYAAWILVDEAEDTPVVAPFESGSFQVDTKRVVEVLLDFVNDGLAVTFDFEFDVLVGDEKAPFERIAHDVLVDRDDRIADLKPDLVTGAFRIDIIYHERHETVRVTGFE